MEFSEESQLTSGLGLIPGKVKYFYNDESFDNSKVPNIGWRSIIKNNECKRQWDNSILDGIDYNDQCYFIHSLCVTTSSKEDTLSLSLYFAASD